LLLPTPIRQRIHRRYLKDVVDRAIGHDAHVHLWTHLYNIANEKQLQPILSFLEFLADKDEAGDVRVQTMDRLPSVVRP
jgi:hypothetical protein